MASSILFGVEGVFLTTTEPSRGIVAGLGDRLFFIGFSRVNLFQVLGEGSLEFVSGFAFVLVGHIS